MADEYYVDSDNGNNGDSGSKANPWLTVDYAITTASGGDTIYLMQSPVRQYPEGITLNAGDGGGSGNPITVISYDDDDPTVISTGAEWDFNGVDYITFNNLIFDDCERWELGNLTYPGGQVVTGLTVQGCLFQHWTGLDNGIYAFQTTDMLVEDCDFVDCRSRIAGNDFTMFRMAGRTNDFTVRRCSAQDIGSDFITLCGNFTTHPAIVDAINVLIEYCAVWINRPYGCRSWHDFSTGIGENAFDFKYVPTGPVTVSHCVVHGYRPTAAGQDASNAIGPATICHQDASNITYDSCRIYDCAYGVRSIKGTHGVTGSSDITVKNCIIHDMTTDGGGRGTGIEADDVDGLTIEHTTIEGCTRYLEIDGTTITSIKNNAIRDGTYQQGTNTGEGNFDYNGWYNATPPAAWQGANDPTITTWGLDAKHVPGMTSDLLDAGTDLSYSEDIAGRARDATPALGASEQSTDTELVNHSGDMLWEDDLADSVVDADHVMMLWPGTEADQWRHAYRVHDTDSHYREWSISDYEHLSLEFYLEPGQLTMADGDVFSLMEMADGAADAAWIGLLKTGSDFYVRATAKDDGDSDNWIGSDAGYSLGDIDRHKIEVELFCANNPGDDDGYYRLWIDDVLQGTASGLDNDTFQIDTFRFGVRGGVDAGTGGDEPGEMFLVDGLLLEDAIQSHSQSAAGALTSAGAVIKLIAPQAIVGTLTSAGAAIKQVVPQALTGGLTSAGTLAGQARKVLQGTLTTAGVRVVLAQKILSGVITSAGVLVTQLEHSIQVISMEGALGPTGEINRYANRALSGTLSGAGVVIRQAGLPLAGILSSAGELVGRAGKALVGTLTSAGAVTTLAQKVLASTLVSTGAISRHTAASLAGVLTTAGAVIYQAGRLLSGTLTSAGAVGKQAAKSFAGAVTTAGVIFGSVIISVGPIIRGALGRLRIVGAKEITVPEIRGSDEV